MHTALVSVSQTLAALLRDRLESDPALAPLFNPGLGGTMVVSLNNPKEMADSQEGLSLWLYRVMRDDLRLNDPPTRLAPNLDRRPPLPVRLHYLLTPFVRAGSTGSPEVEQTVMGKVLQAFHDHPRFQGADLQGDLNGSGLEFHIRIEMLTLEDLTRIWTALAAPYQLSVSYEVSIVNVDSMRTESVSPVLVAEPRPAIIVEESPGA
jgi:hypothetical protein